MNLATILAMQKLVNGNCEGDKGLDLIVLDEILSPVDEDGLASMFRALNKSGITALVVSHGNISESYPYKLIINKQDGKSISITQTNNHYEKEKPKAEELRREHILALDMATPLRLLQRA